MILKWYSLLDQGIYFIYNVKLTICLYNFKIIFYKSFFSDKVKGNFTKFSIYWVVWSFFSYLKNFFLKNLGKSFPHPWLYGIPIFQNRS